MTSGGDRVYGTNSEKVGIARQVTCMPRAVSAGTSFTNGDEPGVKLRQAGVDLIKECRWSVLLPLTQSDWLLMSTSNRQQDFAVGSLVQLKSGGPPMTVVAIADESYSTAWFVNEGILRDVFPAAALISPTLNLQEMSNEQLLAIVEEKLEKSRADSG